MPEKRKKRITAAQKGARSKNIIEFNSTCDKHPATKSGIQSAEVQNGRVPAALPDAAEINTEVDSLVAQIVADLGGPDEVSANRKTIIAAQRTVLTVLALAQRYITREGLLSRKGKPHPLLGLLVSYVNSARLNAVSLGLERKPRKANGPASLQEFIELHGEKPSPEAVPEDPS